MLCTPDLKLEPMRRSPGKFLGQSYKVQIIFFRKPPFPKPVLLGMVVGAEADAPAVGRLQACAAIGAGPDMGAFDWQALAAGDTAVVFADPGTVRGT